MINITINAIILLYGVKKLSPVEHAFVDSSFHAAKQNYERTKFIRGERLIAIQDGAFGILGMVVAAISLREANKEKVPKVALRIVGAVAFLLSLKKMDDVTNHLERAASLESGMNTLEYMCDY